MKENPGAGSKLSRRAFHLAAGAFCADWTWPARAGAPALRVSATPSIFQKVFKKLVQEFESLNPGVVVDLSVTARTQEDQIQGTLRDALIGNAPDVSFEGLNYLRLLQTRKIAQPLGPLTQRDGAWSIENHAAALSELGSVNGSVVGLATALSIPIIYYNTDRVVAAWGSRPIPEEWDSMLALLDALQRNARAGQLGAFCQHDKANWIYFSLVEALGGRMMTADERRIAFDQPPGLHALEIYQAFGRAGQARADMDTDQARQAFAGGGIGLLVDSSSSLTALERQVGDRFRLGTARLPLIPGGHLPAAGIAAILQTRDPSRVSTAWSFMKFVTGLHAQTLIGKDTGYLPANNLVVRRRDCLGAYYDAHPLLQPVIASMPFATRWHAFPGNNAPQIDAVIFDAVSDVVTLFKPPAQALNTMKRLVQELLA